MIRRALAEFLGTAFLLVAVVGSGIAAARLSPTDIGLQLLENAAVTGVALGAIILMFGPVSGGHFNPLISLVDLLFGGLPRSAAWVYVGSQLAGGVVGVILANLMFSLPAVSISATRRVGGGILLGEAIATFGLVLVVFALSRSARTSIAPFAVGAYIAGAYFFTSSTSFANPAVTLARTLSDTFAGIAPAGVGKFVLAQLVGAALGAVTIRYLYPDIDRTAEDVVIPRASRS